MTAHRQSLNHSKASHTHSADIPVAAHKVCTCCHQDKPAEAFYLNHRYKTGLSSRCKDCTRQASLERGKSDPEGKKARLQDWRARNPEKARAQKLREYESRNQRRNR